MIELKAAVGFNGWTEELIQKAVENLEVRLPEDQGSHCYQCNSDGAFEVADVDLVYPEVTIKNTPGYRCTKCGSIEYTVPVLEAVEALIEKHALKGELQFEELYKL